MDGRTDRLNILSGLVITAIYLFNIYNFIFCSMTDRLTDKVNYILDALLIGMGCFQKKISSLSWIAAEKLTSPQWRYGLTDGLTNGWTNGRNDGLDILLGLGITAKELFNVYILIFCSRTDRPTDKVNYKLDAHWHRESTKKSALFLE